MQWYVEYFKRPLGLVFTLIMILMAYEVAIKKPLCINSSMVYKIDRITSNKEEAVFGCTSYKKTSFSTYFYENASLLSKRLTQIEYVLQSLQLQTSVSITIASNKWSELKVEENKILIGAEQIYTKLLEKAVVLSALKREKLNLNESILSLLAEIIVDEYSADSLLSEIWQESYNELSPLQKFSLRQYVFTQISQKKLPQTESSVDFVLQLVQNVQTTPSAFAEVLKLKFQKYGLLESVLEFDVLLQVSQGLKYDINLLQQQAKKFKNSRAALQIENDIYVLPYLVKLSAEQSKKIKINNRIYVSHNKNTLVPFSQFFKNTEKLVVIDAQNQIEKIKLEALFKNNLKSFLLANKQFDFIQFHVPSLQNRLAQLQNTNNYFDLLKKSQKEKIKKQGLGWESLSWADDVQAFKPIAVYDVIQYYRLN